MNHPEPGCDGCATLGCCMLHATRDIPPREHGDPPFRLQVHHAGASWWGAFSTAAEAAAWAAEVRKHHPGVRFVLTATSRTG